MREIEMDPLLEEREIGPSSFIFRKVSLASDLHQIVNRFLCNQLFLMVLVFWARARDELIKQSREMMIQMSSNGFFAFIVSDWDHARVVKKMRVLSRNLFCKKDCALKRFRVPILGGGKIESRRSVPKSISRSVPVLLEQISPELIDVISRLKLRVLQRSIELKQDP